MSDYLWDKTGEPDAEAERLEELLGGLRFQPRTFEVPATLPFAPRRARQAPSHFSWSRAALAASLVFTLLVGAWLVVSKRRTANAPQLVSAPASNENAASRHTPQGPKQEFATASPNNTIAISEREGRRETVGQVATVEHADAPNVQRRQRAASFVAARKRFDETPRHLTVRNLNAPGGELATNATMTPQEREAMGKFMLAMKVTSEKLGYAERQVAGLGHDSPQR